MRALAFKAIDPLGWTSFAIVRETFPNVVAREPASRPNVVRRMHQEHTNACSDLLCREPLWEQVQGHDERGVRIPIGQVEPNLHCVHLAVFRNQRCRDLMYG